MATNGADDKTGEPTSPLQQLAADITTLIRHEVELAKAELGEKIKSAGIGAGMLSASAITGLLTVGCLTALVALLLSLVIPGWAAVLAITVLWGAVTAVLAMLGKKKVENAAPFVPEQTIENVKEDLEWARQRAKQQSRT
ncbi:MAG: phage holin family protein [Candidatus Eremiobacteraeota bacterium]|nr:phage holin family protein [Candidatus Eremiobacteraeota bacterium]